MTGPPVTESDLHAYLDRRLPEERTAQVEDYLAQHPEESKRLAQYQVQEDALRELFNPVLDKPIPARLRVRNRPSHGERYAVAAAWLVIGIALGWGMHGLYTTLEPGATPAWAHRAAVAHAVYSADVRHPVEVGANEEGQLVSWLSKRLRVDLKVPRLDALGFTLIGGRLLPAEGRPAALFMYEDASGERLTLYVRANEKPAAETALRYDEDRHVGVFYWLDEKCGYAISGEMQKSQLQRIAREAYRQLDS